MASASTCISRVRRRAVALANAAPTIISSRRFRMRLASLVLGGEGEPCTHSSLNDLAIFPPHLPLVPKPGATTRAPQFPVISEALLNSASPQVRNQATIGGNL